MIAGIILGVLIASIFWCVVALKINNNWYKENLKLIDDFDDFCTKMINEWRNESITKEGK